MFHKFFSSFSRKTWIIFFGATIITTHLCMITLATTANIFGQIAFIFSTIYQGTILYLLLSVLTLHFLGSIFKLSLNTTKYLSLALTLLIVIYALANASIPRVTEITIPVAGLTKEIKVVHLTDIHLGHFRRESYLEKIVNLTNDLNPDLILNTGDLFDSRSALLNTHILTPFKNLKAPHYFVEGNHDKEVGVDEIMALLKNNNVYVLQNDIASFGELQIVGLKYMLADQDAFDLHATEGAETIQEALQRLPINKTKPTIMLHHSPSGAQYADNVNIDLLLAGHTHGGQLFPFNLISNLLFDYNDGLYQYKNLAIYVSEGLGTIFIPMRVGTISEITLIHLVPKI